VILGRDLPSQIEFILNEDVRGMCKKEEIISKILDIEWKMFEKVSSIDGNAACQEDPATFKIMRTSQAMSWSMDILECYLEDLEKVQEDGRNLMTEKYARMMASTSPLEFEKIAHSLPPLAPEVSRLIDKIVAIILKWEEDLLRKYPNVVKRGRPLRSSEDSVYVTSLETYLRGELSTYSQKTLELYYDHVSKQESENINGSEITLEHTVKQYGYASLKKANEMLNPSTGNN
jgi:hypothetical protein